MYKYALLIFIIFFSCKKNDPQTNNSTLLPPTAENASYISTNSFVANWIPVTGVNNYLLFIATDIEFESPLTGYNPLKVSGNNSIVNGLTPGTNYFYRVQSTGNSKTSEYSNIISVNSNNLEKQWIVSTFAGASRITGDINGDGINARFNFPGSIGIDANDNLYITDQLGAKIKKITPSGVVSNYAGNGDGPQLQASSLVVGSNQNVYFFDNSCIRKIGSDGSISTVAGTANYYDLFDGQGSSAKLTSGPMTADPSGNIYFYQSKGGLATTDAIRKLSPTGYVTTIKTGLNVNPTAAAIVYHNNNLYFTNGWNFQVIKMSLTGTTNVFAGVYSSSSPSGSYLDGSASIAKFGYLKGLCLDKFGNFYVTDGGNSVVRKINTSNIVSTFAGTVGVHGYVDGPALSAQFPQATNMVTDSKGDIFIIDQHCIRKISYK